MRPGTLERSTPYICIAISVLLLCYTGYRAWCLPLTHDEAFSYLYMAPNTLENIFTNRTEPTVADNNHMLNTVLMKLEAALLGNSEFALRLHALICHALFLLFSYHILRSIKNGVLVVVGFILINANPYLLDILGLARGYTLSCMLTLVGVYYMGRYLAVKERRYAVYALAAATVSVFANLAMMLFFIAIAAIYVTHAWTEVLRGEKPTRKGWKAVGIVFLFALFLGLTCFLPIMSLINAGGFYFGGTEGLWADTVSSLIDKYIYDQRYGREVFYAFVLVVSTGMICYFVYSYLRKKVALTDPWFGVAAMVLFWIALGIEMQHLLLGIRFPVERVALFLAPLFVFCAIHLLAILIAMPWGRVAAIAICTSLFVAVAFHCGRSMNLSYSLDWRYGADDKLVMKDLRGLRGNTGCGVIWLWSEFIYEPTVNYYCRRQGLNWLSANRGGLDNGYQFCLVNEQYFTVHFPQELHDSTKWKVYKKYPLSHSTLYSRVVAVE